MKPIKVYTQIQLATVETLECGRCQKKVKNDLTSIKLPQGWGKNRKDFT